MITRAGERSRTDTRPECEEETDNTTAESTPNEKVMRTMERIERRENLERLINELQNTSADDCELRSRIKLNISSARIQFMKTVMKEIRDDSNSAGDGNLDLVDKSTK